MEEESAVRRTAGLAVWMSGGGALGVNAMTLAPTTATAAVTDGRAERIAVTPLGNRSSCPTTEDSL